MIEKLIEIKTSSSLNKNQLFFSFTTASSTGFSACAGALLVGRRGGGV